MHNNYVVQTDEHRYLYHTIILPFQRNNTGPEEE